MDKIKNKIPENIQSVMDKLEEAYNDVMKLQCKDPDHCYTITKQLIKSAYSWLERKGER